jgi:Glyoxalase superfamily protein/ClpX C4-type zinc finger
MRTYKDAKTMAKSLRDSLASRSVLLSHSECLEIVAKQSGFTDWNTLLAKLNVESRQLARSEDAARAIRPARPSATHHKSRMATHELIFCSFCDKSKHEVRSLIEGGCRNPALSQCVFICDECVAFCAQVNADLIGGARSPENLSASAPPE